MLARDAIQESGLSKSQIARDAGLSRAALNAWIAGARAPGAESLLRLAAGLEGRADHLRKIAQRLRTAARSTDADADE